MSNSRSSEGYRAVRWLGNDVVLDSDDYGDYILSVYSNVDGECIVNVGLTGAEVEHLASITKEVK